MSDFEHYYRIVYAIIFSLCLGCFMLLIYVCVRLDNPKYCYIDNYDNLGTSFYCRYNKCSSSDMKAIYVKDYILLRGK